MSREVATGAKVFVAIVFAVLGAAFWASSATLVYEFRELDWKPLLLAHSHLFLFFPLYGTLALVAFFYTPAVVLTDFYWRFVAPAGKLRFLVGFAAVIAASASLAFHYAQSERRAIWEISPAALAADRAATPKVINGCREQRIGGELRDTVRELQQGRDVDQSGRSCVRRPVVEALDELAQAARQRGRLADFARSCIPDLYVAEPVEDKALRHCFPAGVQLTTRSCCLAQMAFDRDVKAMALDVRTQSLVARVEEVAVAFKSFFIIVLTVVGFLLAFWQARIAEQYPSHQEQVVRGVLVGSVVMLLWPLMDYSYQLTSDVLFGKQYRGVPPRITLAFSIILISVLLMNAFFFIRRARGGMPSLASVGPIAGTVVTAIAYLSYDAIGNFASGFVGPGIDLGKFLVLLFIAGLGVMMTHGPYKLKLETLMLDDEPARVAPSAAPAGNAPGSSAPPATGAQRQQHQLLT